MSRITLSNKLFDVVVGVDPVTSAFVQVFDRRSPNPNDEADFVVDNKGVRERRPIHELSILAARFKEMFRIAAKVGNAYPNLGPEDVQLILRNTGLNNEDNMKQVYEVLD